MKTRKIHIPAQIEGPGVQRCERCHAKLTTITEDDWENGTRGWPVGSFVSSDGRGNMSVIEDARYSRPCGRQR